MGNKDSKSEICLQLQGHDLVRITETWWEGSHDWSVAVEEYMSFMKDGMRRGSCPLCERAVGVRVAQSGDG